MIEQTNEQEDAQALDAAIEKQWLLSSATVDIEAVLPLSSYNQEKTKKQSLSRLPPET